MRLALLPLLIALTNATGDSSKNSSFLSPNLYFVGFSKCGTTSMARLLVDHPLVVDVGDESYHPGSESHIFDHFGRSEFNSIQTERLQGRLKSKQFADEIIQRGIMMHYTPNYAGLKNIEDDIAKSLKENDKSVKSAKFFFMLRDPTSRAASSWWYKNHCYKTLNNACPKFKKQMSAGIEAVNHMERCYSKFNVTLPEVVAGLRDGQRNLTKAQQRVLDLCPITLMAPPNTSLYGAHIGKSVYVYQLAHWFDRIRSSQIHIMFLEHFARNPLREMRVLFDWLGLDLYGLKGYANPEKLYNLTKIQYNVHPIPPEVQEKEIAPQRGKLNEFYRPYVQALQTLLRPLNSPRTTVPSGNWSELLSEVLEDRQMKATSRVRKGSQ
jgi:hypothetical protein